MSKNVRLHLNKDPKEFHVQVDWSSRGFGYFLLARPFDKGMLAGLNSKKEENDRAIFFLREMMGFARRCKTSRSSPKVRRLFFGLIRRALISASKRKHLPQESVGCEDQQVVSLDMGKLSKR